MFVYWNQFSAKLFLLAAIFYFLYKVFSSRNKNDEVLLAAAYMTGFEVFSRMTGGAFSYEFAKYSVMGFLALGMFYRGFHRKSWPYIFFLMLLLPGVLFSAINLNYETNVANAIGFNLSGPVCLAISALYCYDRKMSSERFNDILVALLLPVVSTTVYLYVYTPSIKDVVFNTASNFAASGGFGPNQVATILGLGMIIIFARLLIIKDNFINSIDLILLIALTYRAIVTFSRGGVVTAGICSFIFLVIYFLKSKNREVVPILGKIGIVAVLIALTWVYSSVATSGLIDKRYSNQNALGVEKEDMTSGRTDLLDAELDAFYKNPITGVGVGKIKEYRLETIGRLAATHNEVSRILSEHGVFGLIGLIVLMIAPLMFWIKNRSNLFLFSFLFFWFLTISHSSMRIAAPAFIYGLCLISIVNAKKK
jgi:hypothetical protein